MSAMANVEFQRQGQSLMASAATRWKDGKSLGQQAGRHTMPGLKKELTDRVVSVAWLPHPEDTMVRAVLLPWTPPSLRHVRLTTREEVPSRGGPLTVSLGNAANPSAASSLRSHRTASAHGQRSVFLAGPDVRCARSRNSGGSEAPLRRDALDVRCILRVHFQSVKPIRP